MSENRTILPPEVYIRNMFSAKAARDGGIVRRSIRDVERVMGRAAFLSEMERRGFTTVENAGQFVVFCNRERVRRVT